MKKLLFVGDAACPSGFARATHEILERVRYEYAVTVLGINYRGDPHQYPYDIYASAVGGDAFGVGRLIWMCDLVKPDVIVIQQDGWHIPSYVNQLRLRQSNGEYAWPEYAGIPVIAAVAVDGKNFRGEWLEGVELAVFWTQFALNEARLGGFMGRAAVIPLGVDLDVYHPMDREAALTMFGADGIKDRFIVGNINRNQPRKRWDLTIQYFAEWIHSRNIKDAQLFFHCAPTGEMSIDVLQMARYYNISECVGFRMPAVNYGIPEEEMRATYNCFDAQISTTQGEGFGLTTIEGMACGVPQIIPDWSALGEWAKGAVMAIPCTSIVSCTPPYKNVLGGVPDKRVFIDALDMLYRDKEHRRLVGELGFDRAQQPQFRWQSIGEAWVKAIDDALSTQTPVWQDLAAPESGPWQELSEDASA